MRRVVAAEFTDPPDAAALSEEPLVIHQREAAIANPKPDRLRSRARRQPLWGEIDLGQLPLLLFEDLPELDIGLYSTAPRRAGLVCQIDVAEDEARVFADLIRDQLADYETIVLIGHSMGGLLCKAAIHELWCAATATRWRASAA